MPQPVRVGIVGTGGIARSHAKSLLKIDDVAIVAGCDIDEEARASFAEQFEVEHMYEDFHQMMGLEEMDAVSVCTPNYAHKDPTVAALEAGKHVLVEKPMAMNAGEAQEMVDAATDSEATLTMGFQWRLGPAPQTIKRFVDEGQIGKVLFARVQALRRRGIPSWGVFGQKELQGGGPLIDIGVHLIETAHYLIGEPELAAASAQMFTYLGDRPPAVETNWGDWDWETYNVEDLAVGFLRFKNGAVMSVESSFAAHIEKNQFGIQIMGEDGGCTVSPPMVFKDEAGTMVNVEPGYVGKWNTMQRKINDWIARLRGEKQTECPAESGLKVQRILDALYESAEQGREITL